MANISVREYHPESGAILGKMTTLNYGRVKAGGHSRVKVIDISFEGVSNVSNVKIGLISSGNISDANHFGIVTSDDFNATIAANSLESHFEGINGTGDASDVNNVAIGMRNDTISQYIYLDIEISSSLIGAGNGAYKIFFDYS